MECGLIAFHINVSTFSQCFSFSNSFHIGVLKVWKAETSQCVFTQSSKMKESEEEAESSEQPIVNASFCAELNALSVTSFDQNITLYNLDDLSPIKHVCTFLRTYLT